MLRVPRASCDTPRGDDELTPDNRTEGLIMCDEARVVSSASLVSPGLVGSAVSDGVQSQLSTSFTRYCRYLLRLFVFND